MKKLLTIAALLLFCTGAFAQETEKVPALTTKLSGYVMTQATYNSSAAAGTTGNLRLVRFQAAGKILGDFDYRLQLQLNGTSNSISGPRIVDAYVEWQKFKPFYIKVGQFKRAFTFENPMHPIDQGFYGYSQAISILAGMNDRVMEHASNGRDLGIQFQGDLFRIGGHPFVHYQIGVFNGQGINVKDVDNMKDVIGGIWFMPVKGMRIGAFGWYGTYARSGYAKADDEAAKEAAKAAGVSYKAPASSIVSLPRRRYAISGEYNVADWTFRSEYVHSYGDAFASAYGSSYTDVNGKIGKFADAGYALVIAPVIKGKLYAKARYDVYRDDATWDRAIAFYDCGAHYNFSKNLTLSGIYSFVVDKTKPADKTNYSKVDFQLSFRF